MPESKMVSLLRRGARVFVRFGRSLSSKHRNSTPALDTIIAPEVKDDQFYFTLSTLAGRPDLKTFLEIGSSSGAGSTKALVEGISRRPDAGSTRLFCMELSAVRFGSLNDAYSMHPFFRAYNLSSASLDMLASDQEVTDFYNKVRTKLNDYPLEVVLGWLHQDIEYIKAHDKNACGIDVVKQENAIENFDFVLIDGSEFTGERELLKTIGAKVIALDDVNSFKCYNANRALADNPNYKLITQDLKLRNGFAVYEKQV